MLFPKKVKHRKWQTSRRRKVRARVETRGTTVAFGAYGLKSLEHGRVNAAQIEAGRRAISRLVSKGGKLWTRIFPDRPYTAKAAETGMGKGKGDPQGYEFEVLPGRIIFEVDGVVEHVAREALRKAGAKLPIKTKAVERG